MAFAEVGGGVSRDYYAYAWNDPLKYIDPSGHSLFGDILGILVAIVVAYFAPELLPSLFPTATSVSTLALVGFVGGFVGAIVSTGSLSAALTAGIIGAITGAAFYEAGTFAQWASKAGPEWSYAAGVVSHAADSG